MDDKTREDFIGLFNDGFTEVVMPQIERIDNKLENIENRLDGVEDRLDGMEGRLATVENRLESVDRKVDRILDKQLDHNDELQNQGKKILKLEKSHITA